MFEDRKAAGLQLVHELAGYQFEQPLVMAIPRGGVPVAKVIADELDGDLDVVLVRKLGAPWHAEFAIGAVDEQGRIHLGRHAELAGASPEYIEQEKNKQMQLMKERRQRYYTDRQAHDPEGRFVIVVDDGLATGATMIAALNSLREQGARVLLVAVPVASAAALAEVRHYADEVVCLDTPVDFHAVGQFYRDFRQVDDDEVIETLKHHHTSHEDMEPPRFGDTVTSGGNMANRGL